MVVNGDGWEDLLIFWQWIAVVLKGFSKVLDVGLTLDPLKSMVEVPLPITGRRLGGTYESPTLNCNFIAPL